MSVNFEKIGFGGGCHWCTEAVFQSLIGVADVDQGWISAPSPDDSFSEAVVVTFDPAAIDLKTLVEIHLRTHSSASDHVLRGKYRSAVYVYSSQQKARVEEIIHEIQEGVEEKLLTRALMFVAFKRSDERFRNYYKTDSERPFCKTYIDPKLALLLKEYRANVRK